MRDLKAIAVRSARFAILACLVLSAGSALAKPGQRGGRTLESLIELALKSGLPGAFLPAIAEKLGLPRIEHPSRDLLYKQKHTPDKRSHVFSVVLSTEPAAGAPKIVGLAVELIKATKADDAILLDGTIFWATTTGVLVKALRNTGKVGEKLDSEELSLTSDLRSQFQRELRFHLVDVERLKVIRAQ